MAWMVTEKTFLNPSYHRDIVTDEIIFSNIMDTMLHNVYFSDGCACCTNDDGDIPLSPSIQEQELKETNIIANAFHTAFHEEWLEEQYLLIVDDILAMVKGEQESVAGKIDVQDNKERFREEIIEQTEKHLSEEVDKIESIPEDFETLAVALSDVMDLPEQLEVANTTEQFLTPQMEKAIYNIQIFRQYFFLFYFAFVLFFVLSYLLAGKFGGLKWFGAAVLFAGLTFLGGIYLFRMMVFDPFVDLYHNWVPLEPAVISSLSSQTIHAMSIIPLLFGAFGLALLVGGIVAAKKQNERNVP